MRTDSLDRALAAVTPTMAAILRALSRGKALTARDLADRIYSEDPDGGPTWADTVVTAIICRQRKKIEPFDWRIVSRQGSRSGYRLERFFDVAGPEGAPL